MSLTDVVQWLENIACYVAELPQLFVVGIIDALNLVIVGLAAGVGAIVAVLPDMPTSSSFLPSSVLSAANWFYPFGDLVDAVGIILGLWIGFQVVKIALNWLKVLTAG